MIRVDPPITDGSKWGYRGAINYSPDGTNRTGLKILPASFSAPLVRIKTIAEEIVGKYKRPPDHWFLAGNLTIVHGTWRDVRTVRIPLNCDSYYPLKPIAIPYQLGFDAVDWLPSLSVEFYEWISDIQDLNFSNIDLKLNQLISEFQAIQQEIEILFPLGDSSLTDSSPLPFFP